MARRASCQARWSGSKIVPVGTEPADDVTLIMEVLFDIRRSVDRIIELLEDDDDEAEEENG
jgi:hypothetical protein